jgi:hypothetical protein
MNLEQNKFLALPVTCQQISISQLSYICDEMGKVRDITVIPNIVVMSYEP